MIELPYVERMIATQPNSGDFIDYRAKVLKPLLPYESMAGVPFDGDNADHWKAVERWVTSGCEQSPFLLLFGPTGTGKTTLAIAAAVKYADTVAEPTILNERQWRGDWSNASSDSSAGLTRQEVMERGLHKQLLVIDDLGKAKPTEAWFECLSRVIDERHLARYPTLITTNHSPENLRERYEPSFVSRLQSGGVIVVNGPDRRHPNARATPSEQR
jgi:DNA replication protein DnaC